MKVWVLRHTFLKEKYNFHFLNICHDFLKKNISFSEKITVLHNSFHSQILLQDQVFWQFSIDPGYVGVYGKLRNQSKIAPGGLWKLLYSFLGREKMQILDKLNPISLNVYPQYDQNRVYHEKTDVLGILKLWQFFIFEGFKPELLSVKVG